MFRQGMNEFCRWLNGDSGILSPKIALRSVGDSMDCGHGLFANDDILLNDTLITVPECYLITASFVAQIPEYSAILERHRLEPAEILALFFVLERVHFDFFCEQREDGFDGSPSKSINYVVQWNMEKPPGLLGFLKRKRSHGAISGRERWWRPYLGVLPRQFDTPLFKCYLAVAGPDSGSQIVRELAAQLPQQARDKLLEQLNELRALEMKLFDILNDAGDGCQQGEAPSANAANGLRIFSEGGTLRGLTSEPDCSREFWRQICCWAWHIVNTRCIFVDHLPSNQPLIGHLNGVSSFHSSEARRRQKPAYKDGEPSRTQCDAGSLALIPLVDMLNHRPDAQCVPAFDRKSHSYLVRAERHAVAQGQQLFVCYGAHDNARLWLEYGFRMPVGENLFDRVDLPLDLFISLAERSGMRISSTRRDVLLKAALPCIIYASDELPNYALRKNCSILLLPKEKLANWSQHIFAESDNEEEEDEEKGGQRRRELDLLAAMLERLVNALEARKEQCADPEARPFWTDQIELLQGMLANLRS